MSPNGYEQILAARTALRARAERFALEDRRPTFDAGQPFPEHDARQLAKAAPRRSQRPRVRTIAAGLLATPLCALLVLAWLEPSQNGSSHTATPSAQPLSSSAPNSDWLYSRADARADALAFGNGLSVPSAEPAIGLDAVAAAAPTAITEAAAASTSPPNAEPEALAVAVAPAPQSSAPQDDTAAAAGEAEEASADAAPLLDKAASAAPEPGGTDQPITAAQTVDGLGAAIETVPAGRPDVLAAAESAAATAVPAEAASPATPDNAPSEGPTAANEDASLDRMTDEAPPRLVALLPEPARELVSVETAAITPGGPPQEKAEAASRNGGRQSAPDASGTDAAAVPAEAGGGRSKTPSQDERVAALAAPSAFPTGPARPLGGALPGRMRPAVAAVPVQPPWDARCRAIVLRAQLGEETNNADRSFLRNGCSARR